MTQRIQCTSAKITIPVILAAVVFLLEKSYWMIIIGRVFMGMFFISVGYYGEQLFSRWNNKRQNLLIPVGLILIFLIGKRNPSIDLWGLNFGNPVLYITGSLIGSYTILSVSKQWTTKAMCYLGRNSMIILGTHKIFLEAAKGLLNMISFDVFVSMIILLIVLLAEIPVIYLCNHYVPKLTGK